MKNKLHIKQPDKNGKYRVWGRNGESSIMEWTNENQFGHLTYIVYEWAEL